MSEVAPVVVRNGVSKTLVDMVFGKKSDSAGKHFWAPVLEEANWTNDLSWLGVGDAVSTLNAGLRRTFADIYLDNISSETGVVNEEQMQLDWADFTAGVQKLSDIDDQLDEHVFLTTLHQFQ